MPEGSYRIRFGGKGRLDYRTDSVYDIHVTANYHHKSTVTDISSSDQGVWQAPNGKPKREHLPKLMKFSTKPKS
jgi:hypothetical protein